MPKSKQTEAAKRHEEFVQDAIAAAEEMKRTGVAYDGEAVHKYLRAKVRGRKVRRPKPIAWRG